VYISGKMGKFTMENGLMELKKDMGSGQDCMVTHTLVNGRIVKHGDMVFINGKTEINMRVSGSIV
jgi:hypothetical protein